MSHPLRGCGLLAALALLFLPIRFAAAQTVGEEIRALASENAHMYVEPVVSGVATALNSGWFTAARAPRALEARLEAHAMGALVPQEAMHFEPVLPPSLDVEIGGASRTIEAPYGDGGGLSTPTAAGAGPGVRVVPQGEFREFLESVGENPEDFALAFPDGFDLPGLPVAVLQGAVGLPLGAEIAVRYAPELTLIEEVGSIRTLGLGGKISLGPLIPLPPPVDLAVAGSVQTFEVGGYLSGRTSQLSAVAGGSLALLNLYVAGTLERSTADVSFRLMNPNVPGSGEEVAFSADGRNRSRITGGLSLDLPFLRLGAEYAVAEYPVASASFGLRF